MTDELTGKTFIVTGANTGIGKVTALELARKGAHVILACRSVAKTEAVVAEIQRTTGNRNVEVVELDLGDLASVRRCADQLLARDGLTIHGLINNAGLAGHRGVTKDGFEIQFGTNHLGHYLFTRLLLDRIKRGQGRIVNVASVAHYRAHGIDWEAVRRKTRTRVGMHEYSVSKLANVLFTKELARRLAGTGVTTYALHPGGVATDVWRRLPQPLRWLVTRKMLTPEQGAQTTLKCATAPELASETGKYYDDCKERRPSRLADDIALAAELWTKSAEWTGLPT
jgi:retinol dehydrogenase-12